jgi:MFS family permease
MCGLASVMASTAPSLWMYLAFRCASGAALGGMAAAGFALATDLAGPAWRGLAGLLINHFFSLGACAAALAAWWVPSWRWLTFLCGALTLAYVATWSWAMESPHWLLLKGRKVRPAARGLRGLGGTGSAPRLLKRQLCHRCMPCPPSALHAQPGQRC